MILRAMATERAPIRSWFNDNGTGAIYWLRRIFVIVSVKNVIENCTNTQHEHEWERVGNRLEAFSVAG
jgi:hypothetical protein